MEFLHFLKCKRRHFRQTLMDVRNYIKIIMACHALFSNPLRILRKYEFFITYWLSSACKQPMHFKWYFYIVSRHKKTKDYPRYEELLQYENEQSSRRFPAIWKRNAMIVKNSAVWKRNAKRAKMCRLSNSLQQTKPKLKTFIWLQVPDTIPDKCSGWPNLTGARDG